MNHEVISKLEDLVQATLSYAENELLSAPFDNEWRSPCELHSDNKLTYWRPVIQSPAVDFRGLANALECEVHADIITYYSCFWSGTLEAMSDEGRVSLIQLWNAKDFDRLITNLIGHAMAKQRQGQPFTVFFATTEPDSELFLSIDNETGNILLEEPGKPPLRKVEDKLETFLHRLRPNTQLPVLQ